MIGHPTLFAAGDCAVVDAKPRAPSGVWAVRAATPLARNLEAACAGRPLRGWRPQRQALQLLGGFRNGQPLAWAMRGKHLLGPSPWLWRWKTAIDARFMAMFRRSKSMDTSETMACRGCAAKLPAGPLNMALQQAGVTALGKDPEDAAALPLRSAAGSQPVLQSVDGFPALVSDPWLNGRLTALHACSDLWACGARVLSAQAVVTLPEANDSTQQTLLAQTLAGIRSALNEQGAELIGGHTLEARDGLAQPPLSRAVQVTLSVSGQPDRTFWPKAGLQEGDRLLLSRPLGTGVLFAAAMTGASPPSALDTALQQMSTSQHSLLEELLNLQIKYPDAIHAATDITGFGLLGHILEMAKGSKCRMSIDYNKTPIHPEAIALLKDGIRPGATARNISFAESYLSHHESITHLELQLLADPQTSGGLLFSVPKEIAPQLCRELQKQGCLTSNIIGTVHAGDPSIYIHV